MAEIQNGGKADILIKDNHDNEYLIIECKTYGSNFYKAWKQTLTDGDQLFSYAQQIRKTQFLCLYTSNFSENNVYYENKIITLKDNQEYLSTLKPSKRLTYKEASDVKELYNVWNKIYNLEYDDYGIFESDFAPYEINKKKYTSSQLAKINFDDSQKMYHEFATILRQHNVSSHENAFDKLVNIFLAKIVDELEHPDDLQFYWRGIAYDDYYQLQDRLQRLYKEGMQKFLNEEVTYIDNNQIYEAFKLFKNDPDATRDKILEYFHELKFFTNNDFTFIDVHNEKLFKQNSEVLLKIIKMFQNIKLKNSEQNQFLGNLFEGFLDDGVKQSEGQFFTPLPITRFIISSLPLEQILNNSNKPRVLDYACGAGHFLNEYAEQLKNFISSEKLSEYYANVYGIEKEYRLSKISKVSAFMYGQDNINIIYGDALSSNTKLEDESFDVLIANPPFSVTGFLETLDEEDRKKYDLLQYVNTNSYSTNDSIETFFIERAKQFLKPGGIAGIILPISVLTNVTTTIYEKTRELLIEYFDIIGIVELGKGAFGATSTNTVVLFLRKKQENPSLVEHYKNRVNSWFSNNFSKDKIFDDIDLLKEYAEMQNIDFEDYVDFINGNINENLKKSDLFEEYLSNKEIKSIDDIFKEEKKKIYFYLLMKSQKNKVIIVNAPTQTSEIQEYLGYKWEKRQKGGKCIHYIGHKLEDDSLSINKGIETINTPLFDPKNLYSNINKINTIIRENFLTIEQNDNNIENINNLNCYDLTELFEFGKADFNTNIDLSISSNVIIKTDYPQKRIERLLKEINGYKTKINESEFSNEGTVPIISQQKSPLINGYTNNKNVINDLPLIVFGDHTCISKYIDFNFVRGADGTQLLKFDENIIITKFVYFFLQFIPIKNQDKYERHMKYLKNQLIPIPPINIQKNIIKECEEVTKQYDTIRMSEEKYKDKISKIFEKYDISVKDK